MKCWWNWPLPLKLLGWLQPPVKKGYKMTCQICRRKSNKLLFSVMTEIKNYFPIFFLHIDDVLRTEILVCRVLLVSILNTNSRLLQKARPLKIFCLNLLNGLAFQKRRNKKCVWNWPQIINYMGNTVKPQMTSQNPMCSRPLPPSVAAVVAAGEAAEQLPPTPSPPPCDVELRGVTSPFDRITSPTSTSKTGFHRTTLRRRRQQSSIKHLVNDNVTDWLMTSQIGHSLSLVQNIW